MATQTTTTTNSGSDVRLREKKVAPSKQNGNGRCDDTKSLPIPTTDSAAEETSNGEKTTSKPQASTFEQAFFFGLSIDDALNSTQNLSELLYNACKYNHIDLVKRIIDEKPVNVNEPFNNDYPLCIAR
jgi:hypothetical protein